MHRRGWHGALPAKSTRSRSASPRRGATPAADAAAQLESARLDLPSGEQLVVKDAPTTRIFEAVKTIRSARAKESGHVLGRTVTPEERTKAAAIQKALRAGGAKKAV